MFKTPKLGVKPLRHLSVVISEDLYQGLQQKAQEMGELKLSDALRILLREALEKPKGNKARDKQLQYIITTYHLLKEYVVSLENGPKINNKAHEKAEEVVSTLTT